MPKRLQQDPRATVTCADAPITRASRQFDIRIVVVYGLSTGHLRVIEPTEQITHSESQTRQCKPRKGNGADMWQRGTTLLQSLNEHFESWSAERAIEILCSCGCAACGGAGGGQNRPPAYPGGASGSGGGADALAMFSVTCFEASRIS
jgi:hypothetical protein